MLLFLVLVSCYKKQECIGEPVYEFNSYSIRQLDTSVHSQKFIYFSYIIDSSESSFISDTFRYNSFWRLALVDSGSYYLFAVSKLLNPLGRDGLLRNALKLDSTNYLAHRELLLTYQKNYDLWSVRAVYPDSVLKYKTLFEATKTLGQKRLPNWCGWEIYLHDWGR